ncbi:NrfD/PsrC family molybdoenzyme membrane anchor subunit [Saccharomonospora azurea]|uniref:Formate-dependent nitrite reductase, membrane component n=1 Tax=Saccharomonospora azurea NA-128 TaxID=882081 RepID=H8G640_9PSEU|nr:NrfD/PsrC family molybdoenzyme membrane anchor subunit [Saccharomonospora azurea]EHY87200.1 formate-dependent nitrite reductase, membrane component [Saccharomonospora azurea NA-128]
MSDGSSVGGDGHADGQADGHGAVTARPGREAITGAPGRVSGRRRRRGRGEQAMVPEAEFTSYYGKPVLNGPVWKVPDVPAYLFLGGLAGGASLLAAGSQATGRGQLATVTKVGALGAIGASVVALVHDLGRPARFVNMLRVMKPTSPMSMGSWLLSVYGPMAGIAAASDVTGLVPRIGTAATVGAAVTGPGIASYTAALVADTAVPAWHDAHRELPYVFVGSGAVAAGGLGVLAARRRADLAPSRNFALFGTALELAASRLLERRLGMVAEPYQRGRSGVLVRAGEALAVAGTAGAFVSHRSKVVRALSGTALLVGSAMTKWGVFEAGRVSAADPKYTVVPQRERLRKRQEEAARAEKAGEKAGEKTGAPTADR